MGGVRSRRSALRRSCSNMCDEVVAQSQAVAFEAFQERDYRRFWTTQFISNIGSWMQGIAMSFSGPAYQAMVVDLLDERSRLPNAIAMNSLQFNLSRVVGPLIAGVTLSLYGTFWCFFFNAISFLPLIWALRTIRDRQ